MGLGLLLRQCGARRPFPGEIRRRNLPSRGARARQELASIARPQLRPKALRDYLNLGIIKASRLPLPSRGEQNEIVRRWNGYRAAQARTKKTLMGTAHSSIGTMR